jgi:hypothetical protein
VKIGEAIGEVHSSTVALAKELRTAAEGHPSDHALYHVGRMLADRCQGTADTLEPFADRYGEPLNGSQGQGLLGSISTHIRREACCSLAIFDTWRTRHTALRSTGRSCDKARRSLETKHSAMPPPWDRMR